MWKGNFSTHGGVRPDDFCFWNFRVFGGCRSQGWSLVVWDMLGVHIWLWGGDPWGLGSLEISSYHFNPLWLCIPSILRHGTPNSYFPQILLTSLVQCPESHILFCHVIVGFTMQPRLASNLLQLSCLGLPNTLHLRPEPGSRQAAPGD